MNLTIDIGNTFTKIGIFKDNQLIFTKWDCKNLEQELLKVKSNYPEIKSVIVLSVKIVEKQILDIIRKHIQKPIVLDYKTKLDFKINYSTPETLGTDRIAAVAGARFLYPNKSILVIDIGTAITYDILENGENYLGGNISPGMDMRFTALNKFTNKLPLVDRNEKPKSTFIGDSTKSAIYNGIVVGIKNEIDSYIKQTSDLYPNLVTVLTGGDSIFFEKLLKNECFTNKNLIFVGLNHIANINY
jgi:type III pantothenate kinase